MSNIGQPKRIIEVTPKTEPVPQPISLPDPSPELVPA